MNDLTFAFLDHVSHTMQDRIRDWVEGCQAGDMLDETARFTAALAAELHRAISLEEVVFFLRKEAEEKVGESLC